MSQQPLSNPQLASAEEEDPFRFGWRYRNVERPDGTIDTELIPLTMEDLLYPEEGDWVMNLPQHTEDFVYCHGALLTYFRDWPGMVILGDCCVDFGVAGVRTLGPDVLAIMDAREWRRQGTFRMAEEGGRPVLVVEIASPNTYGNDFDIKLDLYHRVGVHTYVIVDRGRNANQPARLVGHVQGPDGWVRLEPNAQGQLDLDPLPLLMGIEDDRPWYYEKSSGNRLLDLTGAVEAQEAAERETREAQLELERESRAREAAENQTRDAQAKALLAETKAREAALAREAAESKARDAESKARDEALAKEKAETRARQAEADRKAMEERLKFLEEELRRRGTS